MVISTHINFIFRRGDCHIYSGVVHRGNVFVMETARSRFIYYWGIFYNMNIFQHIMQIYLLGWVIKHRNMSVYIWKKRLVIIRTQGYLYPRVIQLFKSKTPSVQYTGCTGKTTGTNVSHTHFFISPKKGIPQKKDDKKGFIYTFGSLSSACTF